MNINKMLMRKKIVNNMII